MKKMPQHSAENMRRLEDWVVEPQVKFPPNRWRELVEESEEKRKHFEHDKSTKAWSRWRELRGIAAEEVVSVWTGLPRHKSFTDGGMDFFKSDVKGIPPVRPVLAMLPAGRWVADYYIAVVVDIREHWGSVLGHATRKQVRSATVIEMPNARSLVVSPWELTPGLPAELLQYAELMKATR